MPAFNVISIDVFNDSRDISMSTLAPVLVVWLVVIATQEVFEANHRYIQLLANAPDHLIGIFCIDPLRLTIRNITYVVEIRCHAPTLGDAASASQPIDATRAVNVPATRRAKR